MKISTNQFKNGTKLIIDNAPCLVVSHEFHKPGKGQADEATGKVADEYTEDTSYTVSYTHLTLPTKRIV